MWASPRSQPDLNTRFTDGKIILQALGRSIWLWKMQCGVSTGRTNGAKSAEANVWEVSECIDEYFKPEPGAAISPRCGLSEEEWDRVIGHAELALRSLDRRRPDFARPTLEDARDLANRLAGDGGFHVLLTGRGSRSPPSLKAFRDLVSQEFPTATLHEDRQTNMYVPLGTNVSNH